MKYCGIIICVSATFSICGSGCAPTPVGAPGWPWKLDIGTEHSWHEAPIPENVKKIEVLARTGDVITVKQIDLDGGVRRERVIDLHISLLPFAVLKQRIPEHPARWKCHGSHWFASNPAHFDSKVTLGFYRDGEPPNMLSVYGTDMVGTNLEGDAITVKNSGAGKK